MKVFLTVILFYCVTNGMNAQATASFKASATIIQPIGLTNISNLNFAEIDAREGGEVILTPQGDRIIRGSSTLADGTTVTAAEFRVTGEQGFTYSITLPSASYILSNGTDEMVLRNFAGSDGSAGDLSGGTNNFKIGATLVVNSQQSPGRYSSLEPINISVNYN